MSNAFNATKRKGLFPNLTHMDKHNWKHQFQIHADGSATEMILLNIPGARAREDVIAIHFLNSMFKMISASDALDHLASRDMPWDYQLALTSGNILNIEIVSISDNEQRFRETRHEELLQSTSHNTHIPLSQLCKLDRLFPSPEARAIIQDANRRSIAKNGSVENPFFNGTGRPDRIFHGGGNPPTASLYGLVDQAIKSKEAKPHDDKESTIILIDNRTVSFDIDDIQMMNASQEERFKSSPFRQIWLYTGYYSDYDGTNAEYSLVALKADDETLSRMQVRLNESGSEPDALGVAQLRVNFLD